MAGDTPVYRPWAIFRWWFHFEAYAPDVFNKAGMLAGASGFLGCAVWMLGATGHEIAGCCISARLRDFARFGLFMMGGGVAGGQQVLPDDWIAQATTKTYDVDIPGRGYGYQWWTNDYGSYSAQGIYGQGIFVDAARRLVIASNGNWPVATDPDGLVAEREAFYKRVQAAVDREQAA